MIGGIETGTAITDTTNPSSIYPMGASPQWGTDTPCLLCGEAMSRLSFFELAAQTGDSQAAPSAGTF